MFAPPAAAVGEEVGGLDVALADFFAAHYDRLVGLAALVCHSPSSVEDVVQTAMEQAWRRRATLRDPQLLKPWLDQIVVREAIRINRSPWWARLVRSDPRVVDAIVDRTPAANATWIALSQAFDRLPAEQRAVLALHIYAGYTVEETAELTGAGLETTRSRLRLGRQRLRRELGEEE